MPGLVPGIHVFGAAYKKDVDGRDKPGHDEESNPNKNPGRSAGVSRFVPERQSRWPSSCSSSVNRLMKFKYSDRAPVIAARSATSPPAEA